MQLYGQEYTPDALRARAGNMDQLAGIQLVQLDDGAARSTRAAIVHTGSGLHFTVLLDRGMDIAHASYQGKAMGWRSPTGDVAPAHFEPEGIRWLRSYFGGLLTTCGLVNAGAPEPGSAESGRGLHGRIGNTPARNLQVSQAWEGERFVLRLRGEMREASVFGEKLVLIREIETELGSKTIHIRDEVRNEAFKPEPYMLLYHCNIGWPAVDEGARVLLPSKAVAPRDDEALSGIETWNQLSGPVHGYAEQVFYHDLQPNADGWVETAVVNNGFERGEGFGVQVDYKAAHLPRFALWKQLGEQEFVVGLEPCNCGVEGRHVDEGHGLLHAIPPGGSVHQAVRFTPLTEPGEVEALEALANAHPAKCAESYLDFVTRPKR